MRCALPACLLLSSAGSGCVLVQLCQLVHGGMVWLGVLESAKKSTRPFPWHGASAFCMHASIHPSRQTSLPPSPCPYGHASSALLALSQVVIVIFYVMDGDGDGIDRAGT